MQQLDLAIWILAGFAVLAAVDGLYLHLWRFALHTRQESRFEHLMHTVRAVLFVPIVVLLFTGEFSGAGLWIAAVLVATDQAFELADVLSEHDSRRSLGGLGRFEYAVHATIVSLRVLALALAFTAQPAEAWVLGAETTAQVSELARWVAWNLVPGSVIVALLHVVLALRPIRLQSVAVRICPCFAQP